MGLNGAAMVCFRSFREMLVAQQDAPRELLARAVFGRILLSQQLAQPHTRLV